MTAPKKPGRPDPARGPRVLDLSRSGEGVADLILAVDRDSPWLDGHFPNRPVLSGVVQLRWAIETAGQLWAGLESVTDVTNLKFSHPVLPPAELVLHLEWDEARRRLAFRYGEGERICASGRVRFA